MGCSEVYVGAGWVDGKGVEIVLVDTHGRGHWHGRAIWPNARLVKFRQAHCICFYITIKK